MRDIMKKGCSLSVFALLLGACPQVASAQQVVNSGTPKPECTLRVNVDRNADLPGYLREYNGKDTCYPFLPMSVLAPDDYKGDFYVDEFTDARIREKWQKCKADKACSDAVMAKAARIVEYEARVTGTAEAEGRIDPAGDADLKRIRRPAFFGKVPYEEPIAKFDQGTYVVEFTVPRDAFERERLKLGNPIKLRGWFIKGSGVKNDEGTTTQALIVVNNGCGSETTAIDDPPSVSVKKDQATGKYVLASSDPLSEDLGYRH